MLALVLDWLLAGAGSARPEMIVIASAPMSAQSTAVRASHFGGVNTTYMTATYLHAISRAVERARGAHVSREAAAMPSAAWLVYAVGAAGGALSESQWHLPPIVLPVVVIALITALAWRSPRQKG